MKKFVSGIILSMISLAGYSQYSLDSSYSVSTGVTYKRYSTPARNRNIYVLEISLTEPGVKLQVVKASGVINGKSQTVSAMYSDHDNIAYHDVVAGVNADFFTSTSTYINPRNMLISSGEILWDTTRVQSVFGITEQNRPFIEKLNESYSVKAANGSVLSFSQINRSRGKDQLVLYNRFTGASTGTLFGGTEIKIVPVSGTSGWAANAQIPCKVVSKQAGGEGNMTFKPGEAVLSGVGSAKAFLDRNIKVNDIITLDLNVIAPAAGVTNIKQLCGGDPRLVLNGENYSITGQAEEGSPRGKLPEPRTGVGFTRDKSKLYLALVDGREEGISDGMTLSDFADFLIYLGCYQGMNLDGGGSSAIVVNGTLRNKPSDGKERAVGSAILVYLNMLSLDDFEHGDGRFNRTPAYILNSVGVDAKSRASPSVMAHNGTYSLGLNLNDNISSNDAWSVRLLPGTGMHGGDRFFAGPGTISFWMKTATAAPGAKVKLWINDSDGMEKSPALTVISDNEWHKYTWNLATYHGTTPDTGNGAINGKGASLNSIEFEQPDTGNTWSLLLDDLVFDKNSMESTNTK